MPTVLEHVHGVLARLRFECARVQPRDLRQLLRDPHERIERRHRILEDHRDPLAADLPHLVVGQRQQVDAVEQRLSPETMRPGGVGTSRMIDRLVTDLPEPDSPTMPSVSPRPRSKLTPSTARTTRRPRRNRSADRAPTAAASRHTSASPSSSADRARRAGRRRRSSARTASRAIVTPGQISCHGKTAMFWTPSAARLPHDASGACTPRPRNDRNASSSITDGIVSVA